MPEPDLNFIAQQLALVLNEQRAIRDELRGLRLDLRSMRDELGLLRGEFQLLREQVRIQGVTLARLDDMITMNVLPRLQALESEALTMTGQELAAIRKTLCGINTAAFGRMLGLSGNDMSRSASVRRLERYDRVPEWFAIIARQLQKESSQ